MSSFTKNLAKYLSIDSQKIEEFYVRMCNYVICFPLSNNKDIIYEFRKNLKELTNETISQTKSYEILSNLLGIKNYNLALSKGIDFKKLFEDPTNQKIKTGLNPLDINLLGRLPIKGFISVIAETHLSPSLFCISLGCNAIRQGKKVLHIAIEGQKTNIVSRYFSNLSSVPYHKIIKSTTIGFTEDETVDSKELSQIKSVTKKYDRYLSIETINGSKINVEYIIENMEETYKSFPFDMIILDDLQLFKTSDLAENDNVNMFIVHQKLYKLSKKLNCVIISPVKDWLKHDNTLYSFEIAQISDVIISLKATTEERLNNKMRVLLENQKNSRKNTLYEVDADYSICNMISSGRRLN